MYTINDPDGYIRMYGTKTNFIKLAVHLSQEATVTHQLYSKCVGMSLTYVMDLFQCYTVYLR